MALTAPLSLPRLISLCDPTRMLLFNFFNLLSPEGLRLDVTPRTTRLWNSTVLISARAPCRAVSRLLFLCNAPLPSCEPNPFPPCSLHGIPQTPRPWNHSDAVSCRVLACSGIVQCGHHENPSALCRSGRGPTIVSVEPRLGREKYYRGTRALNIHRVSGAPCSPNARLYSPSPRCLLHLSVPC